MPSTVEPLFALDTATATASIAIYDLASGTLLGESTWQARRRHTQDLLLASQTLMTQVGVQPDQLRALAVTTGPGSFTGVRIALSVIKGIGIALPQPAQTVALPTLTVTAAPWFALAKAASARLCAYIQAGRGRYNWAFFDERLYYPSASDHHAGTATDFAASLATETQPVWLIGESAPDLLDALSSFSHIMVVDSISALRRAGVLAHLAAQQIATGNTHDLQSLQPLYLQGP